MKAIELYFFPTMNGRKILIAFEEMQLPYTLRMLDIRKGDQFQPDFLQISPNAKMPAIVDPDGPGGKPMSVFESGAILQYLGRKTGLFYPADERARIAVEEWLMWQVSALGPMTGQAGHFHVYAPMLVKDNSEIEYSRQRYFNEVNRLHGVLDRRLQGRDFVAGDYSIADMAICPWLEGVEQLGHDLKEFPNLARWYQRVRARPAVARAWNAGDYLAVDTLSISDEERLESTRILMGQTAKTGVK